MVRKVMNSAHEPVIIAADGGARTAQRVFQLTPDIVIGDMDSLSEAEVAELIAQGVPVLRHPREKDETDLELALKWAADHGTTWIRVVGGLGGRLDQTFGNVHLMALDELDGLDVRLIAGKQQVWVVGPGQHEMRGEIGDTISLIPLGSAAEHVTTDGLYYPLNGETLDFGPARGISNVLDSRSALVSLKRGHLLIVHTIGRAE